MKRAIVLLALLTSSCGFFSHENSLSIAVDTPVPCTPEWYSFVSRNLSLEGSVQTPLPGTPQWMQSVENQLGAEENSSWPRVGTKEWCSMADSRLKAMMLATSQPASFSCDRVDEESTEGTICQTPELVQLDRSLSESLKFCEEESSLNIQRLLEKKQREWRVSRDSCGYGEEAVPCIAHSYRRRIAALRATFDLALKKGPIHFTCPANPDGDLTALFYATDPPTLLATREDSTSVLFLVPSESGEKYEGENTMVWEQDDKVLVRWGYGAATLECTK
ncbi:MliC family protein [Desulforhopalus vacuolatus]|uniref:MliC family protein n=1 Tax=Desulforhopalus vacuolatus TaxID=40414 RepID=UPI001964E2AF|nr:MliC family protein [Desulforhopalus vacuolatus]MBM9520023.1 MliC family protein [Desulforhopalus vacuolatus]